MFDQSSILVKILKGAPISILLAMGFNAGQPVNKVWMARFTGYCDRTVRWGLTTLFDHGLVVRVECDWMLSDRGIRLLLELPRGVQLAEAKTGDPELTYDLINPDNLGLDCQDGKNFRSIPGFCTRPRTRRSAFGSRDPRERPHPRPAGPHHPPGCASGRDKSPR